MEDFPFYPLVREGAQEKPCFSFRNETLTTLFRPWLLASSGPPPGVDSKTVILGGGTTAKVQTDTKQTTTIYDFASAAARAT